MEDTSSSVNKIHKRYEDRKLNRVHNKTIAETTVIEKEENIGGFGSHTVSHRGRTTLKSQTNGSPHQSELNCTICSEKIFNTQATWQCEQCFCFSFHLRCIQKWANRCTLSNGDQVGKFHLRL
eukprot:TRINITY_DN6300_c0_g1_i9.p1 TRINITY_DN6300_c0_g1~~TRINITY_DN6300_c0_g1_i9.p1  ORF type:complete len:123 (-),score=7.47 TRINITY_DN6300_c0_g1_i9:116-484(-)